MWLRFRNAQDRFPLYPGRHATLEYAYRVSDVQWGQWFQRAVRHHTLALSIRLVFPRALDATETSATAEAVPLHTPHRSGGFSYADTGAAV